MSPEQEDPEINQNKSQSDKQETESGLLSGGTDAATILDAVTGFNPKAVSIILMQLVGSNPNVIGDVEQILDAMLVFSTFVVAADDDHGAVNRPVFVTLEGVGSAIATRA